ncbi:hypothetical protein [Streptomyces sp. NRRL F-4428]|uniref:hypothetical protein n=1 Tax=Streptomyces sp. NRRL F-4428 TaxID=1609137 RepID=UPI000698F461|nr:hypothetical protein [Streptomyces sp. NRRL F-4428]
MDKMFGPTDHSEWDKGKAALRNFGKSLVAWDEWGKDPARAGGTVVFNVLTIGSGSLLKLGRAGKLGVGAEVATAMGKAGALVDPMSYLGKAANVTKIKVGDFMEGLKASRAGVDDMARNMPGGTSPHPAGTTPPPAGLEYTTPNGQKRVLGHDGTIRDEHGNVVPDTVPVREPHKDDLPNTHEPAPSRERVLEGAGGPSRVENSTSHPSGGSRHNGGPAAPHAGHEPAGGGSHAPTSPGGGHGGGTHDSAGHATGGHHEPPASGHGSGSDAPRTPTGPGRDLPSHDGGTGGTPGHGGDEGAGNGGGGNETPVNEHPLGTPENPHPVTDAQQADFMKSQSELDGLSRKKQIDAVGRGIEVNGQKYKPEAPLLKGAKHGIDWTEGPARASKEAKPQGKFGTPADVQYATERAADIGPGKTGFFKLPEGHGCIEYMPDGTTRTPNSLFVKVYPNGKVHAYPTTR